MKQTIKYKYALDEENHIIDISMIDKSHRSSSNYHCLSCGRELIAKLGEKKQKHFAHKYSTEEFPCSNETYLHQLAKIKIKEIFDKSESLFIKLCGKVTCSSIDKCQFQTNEQHCIEEKFKLIDLKKFYNTCNIEKSIKDFRADLLLENTTTRSSPILIEIFVTHPCSEDKVNSKLPIIEIPIKSEEDIQIIEYNTELYGKTYNLQVKDTQENMERNYIIQKYVLFNSGKYLYLPTYQTTCRQIDTSQYDNSILEISAHNIKNEKTLFLFYAISLGYDLKDCSICQHYKNHFNTHRKDPLCIKYKEFNTPKNPNNMYAYFCSHYKTNKSLYEDFIQNTAKYQIKIIKNKKVLFNNDKIKYLQIQKISSILIACTSKLEQCYNNKGLRLKIKNEDLNLSCYYNSCERFKINDFTYGLKFYHSTLLNRIPLFLYCIKDGYSNTEHKDNTKAIYLKIKDEQSLNKFTSYTGITIYQSEQSTFQNIKENKHEEKLNEQKSQIAEKEKLHCIEELPSNDNQYLDNLFKSTSQTTLKNKEKILDYIEKEFKTKNIFIERFQQNPVSLRFFYNECIRCNIGGNVFIKIFNSLINSAPTFIQPCLNEESPQKNIPTVILRIDPLGMWKEWSHKNCLLIKEGKNGEFYNINHLNEIPSDETSNSF